VGARSRDGRGLLLVLLAAATALSLEAPETPVLAAQVSLTDEQLEAASGGRTVVIGSTTGDRRAARIPLEV
jgi:hypothetical protein